MRYIIDRKTNEHERYDGQFYDATKYRIIEADSEGWIKHEGNECPLPDDVRCEVKLTGGLTGRVLKAGDYGWIGEPSCITITHYRPILTEKVKEPDQSDHDAVMLAKRTAESVARIDLLDRLKAAHKAAQQIPDLEAELREVLADMGYDLVARSPFTQQRHGAQGE